MKSSYLAALSSFASATATVFLLLGVWTTFTVAGPTAITDQACFPPASASKPQFMVGYGSLLQNKSKQSTAPGTGPSIPVRINGYRRAWNTPSVGLPYHTTFLGVVPDSKAALNGIIFQLPPKSDEELAAYLALYDYREDLYCRRLVPPSNIKSLADEYQVDPNGQYWIYMNPPSEKGEAHSSAEYPIVMSYVDVFITGCLELEQQYNLTHLQFAASCVKDTTGWDSCWVNDRIYPRRPFIYQPRVRQIDGLLEKYAPEAFKAVKVEGQCNGAGSGSGRSGSSLVLALVNGLLFVYHLQTLSL